MNTHNAQRPIRTVGIIGFGAFGTMIARSLCGYGDLWAHDPDPARKAQADALGVTFAPLDVVARCDVVIIAAPVSRFDAVVRSIAAVCRPGALIVDVGSVKVAPAEVMAQHLPPSVDIVATHPLFGPESGRNGLAGLKIALCPIRGRRHRPLAAFLRKVLGLQVILTTPHDHDREAAMVQGLTHMIAKVLLNMGPLPTRMTTRSFDLLVEAVSMVQNDAPEVFDAIERANPYADAVRKAFLQHANALETALDQGQ